MARMEVCFCFEGILAQIACAGLTRASIKKSYSKRWIAGSSPATTVGGSVPIRPPLAMHHAHRASRREIAEPLEIGLLLRAARRQLEQAGRVAAENVVLGLLREKRQVPDPARHVEIPVRVIRGVEQLRLRVDHLEGAGER